MLNGLVRLVNIWFWNQVFSLLGWHGLDNEAVGGKHETKVF